MSHARCSCRRSADRRSSPASNECPRRLQCRTWMPVITDPRRRVGWPRTSRSLRSRGSHADAVLRNGRGEVSVVCRRTPGPAQLTRTGTKLRRPPRVGPVTRGLRLPASRTDEGPPRMSCVSRPLYGGQREGGAAIFPIWITAEAFSESPAA